MNNRDFYSVFKTEENFKVVNAGITIGEIPFSPMVNEDQNILLAAKIWKIKYVDLDAKRIEVIKANDGKKPMFFGAGGICHSRIREKMLEILIGRDDYEILDDASKEEIRLMRSDFAVFNINNFQFDRPLLNKDKALHLYTFTGTRINRTICFLFNMLEIKNYLDDSSSSFDIEISLEDFYEKWSNSLQIFDVVDKLIENLLQTNPAILDFSKWGLCPPVKYQVKLIKQKFFDLESTEQLIRNYKFIMNSE